MLLFYITSDFIMPTSCACPSTARDLTAVDGRMSFVMSLHESLGRISRSDFGWDSAGNSVGSEKQIAPYISSHVMHDTSAAELCAMRHQVQ